MRRRSRHAGFETASLLPMVDILFAAVGIFLILVTVLSTVKTREPAAPEQPDMVLVCFPGGMLQLFSPDHPSGVLMPLEELQSVLGRHLNRLAMTRIVCAFSGDAFREQSNLQAALNKMRKKVFQGDNIGEGTNIDYIWWPLPANDPSEIPVVVQWQEGK